MRFNEFNTTSKTPEQLKMDSLKAAKEKANAAIQSERQRQQVAKAQKKLALVRMPTPAIATAL